MYLILSAISIFVLTLDFLITKKIPLVKFLVYIILTCGFLYINYDTSGYDYFIELSTVYILELMLSIDHLFLFATILASTKISKKYEEMVLTIGILFALVIRIGFAFFGIKFIHLPYILEICGIILLYAAYKALKEDVQNIKTDKFMHKIAVILGKKFENSVISYNFIKSIVAIFLIFISDFIFAIDSLPVAISIVKNLDIIIFANVLAVIGMRTLFDVMRIIADKFEFLHYAIATILFFISIKLIFGSIIEIPTKVSLLIVISSITICCLAETIYKKRLFVKRKI